MKDIAIRAENLSKQYHIGRLQKRHDTLRDALAATVRSFTNRKDSASSEDDTFWALKDVSFELERGEVLGVIGRNGAGKSTLLKVLSKITEPSQGRAVINGRVSSLLEVGTGFHPELTGRENVYLNGAILGMRRAEIEQKFDEIVAFAEIEKFLDTPVKRYSSGMYVRLAFAVAAHLEPEILIVDEVLAVGDHAFQQKCLGKIEQVTNQKGRTVLFVSHNMSSIINICTKALLLDKGTIVATGEPHQVVSQYRLANGTKQIASLNLLDGFKPRGPSEFGRFRSIELCTLDGKPATSFLMGQGMCIALEVEYFKPVQLPDVGVVISTMMGQRIHKLVASWEKFQHPVHKGIYRYQITVPRLLLLPGQYTLTLFQKNLANKVTDQFIESAVSFEVLPNNINGHIPNFGAYSRAGEVYLENNWECLPL